MDEMESGPLDYATPTPLGKINPPWRRVIFALSSVLFLAVAIGLGTAAFDAGSGPIKLVGIPVCLFFAALLFGVMAVRAFIESMRTKKMR